MDLDGTSRLSADLKFGTLSARQVWHRVSREVEDARSQRAFLNELVWREFAHSTLWDRPELLAEPFQAKWRGFPWRDDEPGWRAWVEGKTGYPVVDAAARQLLAEGFVHNRARMIAASFLTKHLLLDFRRGEAHYMAHLTDGDWAQNDAGWQWSAGCGCDAQPYFRIFNPVSQGETFDPEGDYVRRWVPELARLPAKFIHEPWGAPREILEASGVRLGATYPHPVVDHKLARERFLATAKAHLGGAASAAASTGVSSDDKAEQKRRER
jgi:deoxyribodipyrimidine photo-lyase